MEKGPRKKTPSRARVSRRNASRRWCVPPALLHEPDELLEGAGVLDELPGPVGLVLWQSLRDVTLWASVAEEAREALFTPQAARVRLQELLASGAEPALEVSLTTLAALVGSPETANPEIVSLVCIQVSRWAEERGAFAAAMGYAQAAALALPLDASPALAAGTLALRWRRSARAETWLRRAVGLGRRRRQWEPYAQAYVELGGLYTRHGQTALAQRFFVQGLRASRRHGLMAVRGSALHGLLLLAVEQGDLDEAERHARGAMRAYGRGHPRLPELKHDVAYLWVRREAYARAIPVLEKLLPTRVEPVERALTLAILARAWAGAGNAQLYQEYWLDAWAVVTRRTEEAEKHARALLELARGSVLVRDWHHVEKAVRLATASASSRGERAVAAQVQELAAAVREQKSPVPSA
jgi:tetratricopeptide (TPR) repeat protein